MYYLTTEAKRKGAKRHILTKNNDIEELRRMAYALREMGGYTYKIFDGKWELIDEI